MTDLKSVGIHGTELAGYSSVVGQPIMLKNEAGNYIGQLALIGFQGKYKEAVSAIAEALDAPSRHAYKVGFAAGRADAMREAVTIDWRDEWLKNHDRMKRAGESKEMAGRWFGKRASDAILALIEGDTHD